MRGFEQLSLSFESRPSYRDENFLVTSSNRDAVSWVDRWPEWPSTCLIIHGPPGCGKTHLSQVFRRRSDARIILHEEVSANLPRDPRFSSRAWILEDIDNYFQKADAVPLFHFFNQVNEGGGTLLINARSAPARWSIKLEDLRSRLNASQSIAIRPPDDELLAAILVKLFTDRQLRVDVDVISYSIKRVERSFIAINELVENIDKLSMISQREITIPLVRQALNIKVKD